MPLRCLIVDDNPYFLEAARGLLEQAGIVVGVASNSAEALVEVEQFRPDVTLVDIQLGEECGVDLARQLTAAQSSVHSNVILCSAHSALDFAGLIADGGSAIAFLPKTDLSATAIQKILERSTGLPSAATHTRPATDPCRCVRATRWSASGSSAVRRALPGPADAGAASDAVVATLRRPARAGTAPAL